MAIDCPFVLKTGFGTCTVKFEPEGGDTLATPVAVIEVEEAGMVTTFVLGPTVRTLFAYERVGASSTVLPPLMLSVFGLKRLNVGVADTVKSGYAPETLILVLGVMTGFGTLI